MEVHKDKQPLSARIAKSEAQIRRLQVCNLAMLILFLGILLGNVKHAEANNPPVVVKADSVEASSFVVKDQRGRICARLSSTPVVEYRNGIKVTILQTDAHDRALLEIFDEDGFPTLTLPPSPTLVSATSKVRGR